MNLKTFLSKSGVAVLLVVVGVIVVILLSLRKLNFQLFLSGTGIENTEEIEYICFSLGSDTSEYTTTYYITDRQQIEKIYDIFNGTGYSQCSENYSGNNREKKTYQIRFGQSLEENRNLLICGYEIEGEDIWLAMPLVESNYGTCESASWEEDLKTGHVYVDMNIAAKLQSFCDSELTYITMDEIEEITENDGGLDVFDFYGYLHEQTDVYNPYDEPAERLYQVNRLEIADYDGYLEVNNQYMTVYDEDVNNCKWYRDILRVSLYDKDGELQRILYEKRD